MCKNKFLQLTKTMINLQLTFVANEQHKKSSNMPILANCNSEVRNKDFNCVQLYYVVAM
jgi:hypothetical protein